MGDGAPALRAENKLKPIPYPLSLIPPFNHPSCGKLQARFGRGFTGTGNASGFTARPPSRPGAPGASIEPICRPQ
jgi:hypothetical protein